MTKRSAVIGITLLLCATSLVTVAQPTLIARYRPLSESPILWVHTYNATKVDWGTHVEQTTDGGYIVTGMSEYNFPWYRQCFLVKTDASGNKSWLHVYGTEGNNSYGQVVHQTADGGYIIVGSVGYTYHYDVQVTKTNTNGDLLWQKHFGTYDYYDEGRDILQTSDGGYLVLAFTNSYGQGGDFWLIKLAADGSEQWNRTIGGVNTDSPYSFTTTSDHGYLIVGTTQSYTSDDRGDLWIVKTDSTGHELWNKTYGDVGVDEEGVCVKAESNDYVILANSADQNGTSSLWLSRIDTQGTMTWSQRYTANSSVVGTSVTPTKDHGYFITGSIYIGDLYSPDLYLLKTTHQGATSWMKTIDLSNGNDDMANDGLQARDGGYIVVGNTGSERNESMNAFLMKIASDQGVTLTSLTGGLRVTAHLVNNGATTATNVTVSLTITGGLLHHINASHSEQITLPAGGEATVSCKPFLGLGPISIVVTADGNNQTFEGYQLLFLTHLQPST